MLLSVGFNDNYQLRRKKFGSILTAEIHTSSFSRLQLSIFVNTSRYLIACEYVYGGQLFESMQSTNSLCQEET
jgi:hypothetical protein